MIKEAVNFKIREVVQTSTHYFWTLTHLRHRSPPNLPGSP